MQANKKEKDMTVNDHTTKIFSKQRVKHDTRRATLIKKNITKRFLFPQLAPEHFLIFSGAGALQQGSKKNFGAG